jgi:uncharacterized membrane protein
MFLGARMNFDKNVSYIIIILLVIAVGATVYIIVNPSPNEKFTELYILGATDQAGNYPTNISLNEAGNVTIGIVNHEDSTTSYNLITTLNGVAISNQNYTLENNQTKNITFSFTPTKTGSNQTLTFNLYKQPNNGTVYRSVFLHINVV